MAKSNTMNKAQKDYLKSKTCYLCEVGETGEFYKLKGFYSKSSREMRTVKFKNGSEILFDNHKKDHLIAMERWVFGRRDPDDLFLEYCYLIEHTDLSLIKLNKDCKFVKPKGFFVKIRNKNLRFVSKVESIRKSLIPVKMRGLLWYIQNSDKQKAIPYNGKGLQPKDINRFTKEIFKPIGGKNAGN